ncbi:hypothetical protein ATCC90586_003872 [Pythium insidiosum]|nr:hypothetical protein ATCC90586_003872 [Pythium insidiosum]
MRRSPSSAQGRGASSRRRHSGSGRSLDSSTRRHEPPTPAPTAGDQDAKNDAAFLFDNQAGRDDEMAAISDEETTVGHEADGDADVLSHSGRSVVGPAVATPFNPLVALQQVLAGDMVPIKQRAKAAKELAEYMDDMQTNQGLYTLYEPYLAILGSVVMMPIKAAKDVQEKTLQLMAALGAHNPRRFVDWCTLHIVFLPWREKRF